MKKNNFSSFGKDVVQAEINALKKLKKYINRDFDKIVNSIIKCKGKVIFSGVGKSGIVAKKIASTNASLGIPSIYVDAGSCSHGDLGMISSGDVVILISHSGESSELKNIIQYVKRNKNITLIGVTSKKNSLLYKSSNLRFLLPAVVEAGPGNYIPTSSTTTQICFGDALAISTIKQRKFSKLNFRLYHPAGSLGARLKTCEDLMLTNKKIPFVKENTTMKEALRIITKKGLGVLLIKKRNITTGILTDGDLKRLNRKFGNFQKLKIKTVMKKNPVSVEKNTLAAEALSIMNSKKITSLCIHKGNQKNKTVGIIHIHNILKANIT